MCHQYILGIDIGTVCSSSVYILIFTVIYVDKRRLQYVGIKEANTSNNDYGYQYQSDSLFISHAFLFFNHLLFVTLRIISFKGIPTSALALGNRFELAVSVILLAIDLAISFTMTLLPQLSGIKVTFICSFTLTVPESIFRFAFA